MVDRTSGTETEMRGNSEGLWRTFHPPPDAYNVRDTTAFALALAGRALRTFMGPDRWELGLAEGRDLVFLEIGRMDGRATPKDLRESLGVSAGSLSTVLRRAVAAEWVVRRRDPADGRTWRLALAGDGGRSFGWSFRRGVGRGFAAGEGAVRLRGT
jgi:hypothetical protein